MNQPVARKVFIVAVQYYLDDRGMERSTAALRSALAAAGFDSSVCVVDLRVPAPPAAGTAGVHPFLDISGFRSGLAGKDDSPLVLLLNDTLFTKHPWRLLMGKLVGVLPLLATMSVPAAAGVVHPSTDLVMLDHDNPTRKHLSTFLVAMNEGGAGLFADLVNGLPEAEDPLGVAWLAAQKKTYPALAPILDVHLGGTANPWAWHGMRRNPDGALVQRKAVTVAIEYLFTCHLLRAHGCILPLNAGMRFRAEAMFDRLRRAARLAN